MKWVTTRHYSASFGWNWSNEEHGKKEDVGSTKYAIGETIFESQQEAAAFRNDLLSRISCLEGELVDAKTALENAQKACESARAALIDKTWNVL